MDMGEHWRTGIRRARQQLQEYAAEAFRQHWRGGAAALVALAGLGLLALGPAWLAAAWQNRSEPPAAPAPGTHDLGEEVAAGPVTFVVHELRCGPHRDATQGRRCDLTVGVRNDGRDEVAVPGGAQSLHVAAGARHLPVRTSSPPFGTLAPAESATAVLTYDLPSQVTITHVELRPDTYAHGVPVSVGDPYPLVTLE